MSYRSRASIRLIGRDHTLGSGSPYRVDAHVRSGGAGKIEPMAGPRPRAWPRVLATVATALLIAFAILHAWTQLPPG